jgi:ABC-type transport system substrate-binding protein
MARRLPPVREQEMRRFLRFLLALIVVSCASQAGPPAGPAASAPPAASPPKVLRYAFLIAETGFDPAQISDLYSRCVTTHVFEALYKYDYLARPFKVKPNTAAALPEASADFRTWTIRIQPGIHFADDPVFKGQRRELMAEDYVCSIKRTFDPANKSPGLSTSDAR